MAQASIRFATRLLQTGKNTTGIPIPAEVITQLGGGARPAVSVKVDNYEYRTTVGVMGDQSLLPFSAEHRAASGLNGGDPLNVEIALDRAPRTLEVPDDLASALGPGSPLHAAFVKQAPSRQKADVENVLAAKAAETRERRIAAIVERLRR